ncbi:MAG: translation initiation factor IF-2 N-terminal domain-containing protein, partial [Sandaracinaceae bacterium]
MSKVRVYEVARELGMNNRELLGRIQSLGIQVRNHMSALEPAEVERVRRALDKDKVENTVETRIRKTVIRRRTKKKPKPEVAEAPAAEARPEPVAAEEPRAERRPVAEARPAPEPEKPAPAVAAEPVAKPAEAKPAA